MLCLGHGITFVREQFGLLSLRIFSDPFDNPVFSCLGCSRSSCLLSDPPSLRDFATAIEQISLEKLSTSEWFALTVLGAIVLYLRVDLFHYLAAKACVHIRKHCSIGGVFEDDLGDLDQCLSVLFPL